MTDQGADSSGGGIECRLARLTSRERECLLLVLQHHSSKEIARQLGISSHTVDQRMRSALKKLGVERRTDAARLLHAWAVAATTSRATLPFGTPRHPKNDMGRYARLLWIALIAIAAAFAAGISLAAAEAFAELARQW